jgi:hypothetical protein
MLAASCIAVCLVPVTFYVVEKFASRREAKSEAKAVPPGAAPTEGNA